MSAASAPGNARRWFAEALRHMGHRPRASWRYAVPGFEAAAKRVVDDPETLRQAKVIYCGTPNTVYRAYLPGVSEDSGGSVAVKWTVGRRQLVHLVHPTSNSRESAFYHLLGRLGLPTAEFLAVGEVRIGWRWDHSFTITRFLDDYSGGDDIDDGRRELFALTAMRYLAVLHRVRLYHHAYKPKNMLWRAAAGGGIDLRLIDFGGCGFVRGPLFTRSAMKDLAQFFRNARLSGRLQSECVDAYLDADPGIGLSRAALIAGVAAVNARKNG
ncbi:MAG: lipopolysaccharide kinase InaA family protein [Planctomycetota bacterium]|nr:lipopolysaccharide kinase InaA family protein [Planctomycetota bacterium]